MTLGRSETITRFGWWGGGHTGSPLKVGEYQGLGTSPFWDIDTIRSNGRGTVDLWGSQLNSEAWDVRSHFFQNGFTGDINFEQFPHLLENSLPGRGLAAEQQSGGHRQPERRRGFRGPRPAIEGRSQGSIDQEHPVEIPVLDVSQVRRASGQLDGPLFQHQPGRGAGRQSVPRPQPAATHRLADAGSRAGPGRQVQQCDCRLHADHAVLHAKRPDGLCAVQSISAVSAAATP